MRPTLLLLYLLAAPLGAQTRYGGGTQCAPDSANPLIYQQMLISWPAPQLDQWRMEYRALLEHEAAHVEQMARYPSCAVMLAVLEAGGVDTLLAWEAEASCAQLKVYAEWGKDPRDLLGVFVARLRDKVRGERSVPEIIATLSRRCPVVERWPSP